MNRKNIVISLCVGALFVGVGVVSFTTRDEVGVLERYEDEVRVEPVPRDALAEQLRLDARMLADVLVEVDKIEAEMLRMNEEYLVSENENVGVYTVEQEDDIAEAYRRYLVLRKALFHIAFRHKDYRDVADPVQQDQSFLLAYASALSLYRNGVAFVILFKDQPNARRKLNEANPRIGVPAGMFDEMYVNVTAKDNVDLILGGVEEFAQRRSRLATAPLLQTDGLGGLLERLEGYEAQLAAAYDRLAEGRADVLWTRVKSNVQTPAYKTQSIVSMMISHLRVPLHAPGFTAETVRKQIRPMLQPGDILLTRRDGYLSNTFLPGHWGHAALYLGSPEEIRTLGADPELEKALAGYRGNDRDGFPFAAIEAIGEGVRFSSAEFAMHANSLAVLRPRVPAEQVGTAIRRAIELRGVPYDFAFDVSTQDKIICTELVYRAYAPHLDVPLEEVMGRKTLKPDGMLKALSPAADDPRTDLVLFGTSVDGRFDPGSLEQLLATVK